MINFLKGEDVLSQEEINEISDKPFEKTPFLDKLLAQLLADYPALSGIKDIAILPAHAYRQAGPITRFFPFYFYWCIIFIST